MLTILSLKRVLDCLWKSGTIPIFTVFPIIYEQDCSKTSQNAAVFVRSRSHPLNSFLHYFYVCIYI